jgi:hypothetical protein
MLLTKQTAQLALLVNTAGLQLIIVTMELLVTVLGNLVICADLRAGLLNL